MKKRQLTEPEPATSRAIADPLAAEPRFPPASIDPFPYESLVTKISCLSSVGVGISKEALHRVRPH